MASRLALRFRSHLLRTASNFQSSLHHHHYAPPIRSPPFFVASLSDVRTILLGDLSSTTFSGHRFLSTARRQPLRSKKTVDIGAKARQLQNRRLWTYALTFSCIAGFIVIVLSNFQDYLVFFVSPTQALEQCSTNPSKTKFRLGGLVVEGSVVHPASSPEVEFVITDLKTDILVRYQGSLPDLFREGHSAVVEGSVKPFTEEIKKEVSAKSVSGKARSAEYYFKATEVLAKHDEKYMPKEIADAIERNKKDLEAAKAESDGAKSSEKDEDGTA